MDVTRHTLDEGVALLRKALESPRCEFVAIDEEMTGISFGNLGFREFNGLGDSPAVRYGKMRAVAASFGLVQLGVAAFVRSDDGSRLRAHVVNCYVFPGERGGRDVQLSAGAIQFLADHGMSFDTWLSDGAPYVNARNGNCFGRAPTNASGSFCAVSGDHEQRLCPCCAAGAPGRTAPPATETPTAEPGSDYRSRAGILSRARVPLVSRSCRRRGRVAAAGCHADIPRGRVVRASLRGSAAAAGAGSTPPPQVARRVCGRVGLWTGAGAVVVLQRSGNAPRAGRAGPR